MDITLPNLGEGAESGIVVNLFVKEGDRIEKDQPLLELENEKAVASIPSTAAGVVTRIHVRVGDKVSVGQRIVTLSGAETAPAPTPALAPPRATPVAPPPAVAASAAAPGPVTPLPAAPLPEPAGELPPASPSIRKLARELGIDLRRVRGSERGGRVVLADLRGYIQTLQQLALSASAATAITSAPAAKPAPEPVDFSRWGPISRKSMTPLRQVIARRMFESWSTIPHVTQFADADFTRILALRKQLAPGLESQGVRLTVTPFVLRALIATLRQHPLFNASYDETTQEIVFKHYYHIGIAVDTEAGLIVPVLRDADKKNLGQLARELEELAQKARERKVTAEELKGGTFTISNQGAIGGAHFTPIINKPEVAILGIGRGTPQPVARGDKIEVRVRVPLALSYDHRVIDGANAARFIVDLVAALEGFTEKDTDR